MFILLVAGIVVGFIVLILEWLIFKYAVPYWRRRQWRGWLFCSQVREKLNKVYSFDYIEFYRSSAYTPF